MFRLVVKYYHAPHKLLTVLLAALHTQHCTEQWSSICTISRETGMGELISLSYKGEGNKGRLFGIED